MAFIYLLRFKTGKTYVGKTKLDNWETRYNAHKSSLRTNRASSLLQREFINSDLEYPSIEILLECELSELGAMERHYISRYGELNQDIGSDSISQDSIILAFELLTGDSNLTLKEISLETGLCSTSLSNILSKKLYKWLSIYNPKKYEEMHPRYNKIDGTFTLTNGVAYLEVAPSIRDFLLKNPEYNFTDTGLRSVKSGRIKKHRGWYLRVNT